MDYKKTPVDRFGRKTKRHILIWIACLSLTSCSSLKHTESSSFVATESLGFALQPGAVQYSVKYVTNSLPDPAYGVIEFENPLSPSDPFVQDLGYISGRERISALSPLFHSIAYRMRYKIILYIYADESKTNLLDTHADVVRYDIPRKLSKQIGLVLL